MPFLIFEDYKTLIKDDVLQAVMDNDKTIVLEVEQMAQAEMESYLNQRYDVAHIFNKTGTARQPLILMYMIDIVLYHIHARINPKFIPDIRKDRYDIAISWLNKVARGDINPDLPKIENPESPLAGLGQRWGSNPKVSHQY